MSLDQTEAKIKSRLGDLRGLNARVKFDFDQNGALFLDAKTSPPTLSRDPIAPDCTIRMSLENFDRMISGRLSPVLAFGTGKIKVQGSMGIAMKLSSLLED